MCAKVKKSTRATCGRLYLGVGRRRQQQPPLLRAAALLFPGEQAWRSALPVDSLAGGTRGRGGVGRPPARWREKERKGIEWRRRRHRKGAGRCCPALPVHRAGPEAAASPPSGRAPTGCRPRPARPLSKAAEATGCVVRLAVIHGRPGAAAPPSRVGRERRWMRDGEGRRRRGRCRRRRWEWDWGRKTSAGFVSLRGAGKRSETRTLGQFTR